MDTPTREELESEKARLETSIKSVEKYGNMMRVGTLGRRLEEVKEQLDARSNRMVTFIPKGGNQNGRKYPPEAMESALKTLNESIPEKTALGQVGTATDSLLHLDRVSHRITDAVIVDGELRGVVEILSTPAGKILQALLDAGTPIAFRPRGRANISDDGEVQNFELVSIDAITDDSWGTTDDA